MGKFFRRSYFLLTGLRQDLSYGARRLRRSPGFTLGAVAVLALGIGANLAEFHILDALMLHRLTIRDAESIVQFVRSDKEKGPALFPQAAFEFYRENSTLFSYMVGEAIGPDVILETDSGVRSMFVSGNYFTALGAIPAWGRLLDERDAKSGAPSVAVVSYEYWLKHLGADPGVVNRTLHINNKPVQIVGVGSYDFDGLFQRRSVVWLPMTVRTAVIPGAPGPGDFSGAAVNMYGNPKPGVSLAAAKAELTSLTRELARQQPRYFRAGERILGHQVQGTDNLSRINPAVFIIVVLVLLVLFSACANLGIMLLACGLVREREIEIRLALGAGRWRVFRQLMVENLLLAALGCAGGLFVGYVLARWLLYAVDAPPNIRVAIDWQILVVGMSCIAISAFVFGMPPALQLIRRDHKSRLGRQILVGLQVAVSCLLLISLAVLTHDAVHSATINLTFDPEKMMVVYPQIYVEHLPAPVARRRLDALVTKLASLPGIDSVTSSVIPPFSGRRMVDASPDLPPVYANYVAPSYFNTMTVPVLRGRTFVAGDQAVAVVSESAARAIWPSEDAISKTWGFGSTKRTIVGVVKDSGVNLMSDPDSIEVYFPIDDLTVDHSALILRSKVDPAPLVRAVQAEGAEAGVPASPVLMQTARERTLKSQRETITMIGSLGLIATLLSFTGMFALLAFAVAQRTREIGIRIAVGARPGDIIRALLRQHTPPVVSGAVLGILLAIALGRVERSLIYIPGVQAFDLVGFIGGLACFAIIAVLATLSPVLKALRIDPSATLRHE